jgi:hypothetical protein
MDMLSLCMDCAFCPIGGNCGIDYLYPGIDPFPQQLPEPVAAPDCQKGGAGLDGGPRRFILPYSRITEIQADQSTAASRYSCTAGCTSTGATP